MLKKNKKRNSKP